MRALALSGAALIALLSLSTAVVADTGLPSTVADAGVPAEILVRPVGSGVVFTDRNGMSLYTYGRDEVGKSKCNAKCVDLWPPVVVAKAPETVAPQWSMVDRGEGVKQWAYKGQPLYTYVKDPEPGASFGDNFGQVWHVATQNFATPPGIGIGSTVLGQVLVDAKAMTLYAVDGDKLKAAQIADASGKAGVAPTLASTCAEACLETWKPVRAPSTAVAHGDWSIAVREDGMKQWAFRGKPLYTYANDVLPTDSRGDGRDKHWHAVVVEPPPPVPTWVTYQGSDAGELLANADGFTIYALNPAQNRGNTSRLSAPATCDADCIVTYWKPIAAVADAKRVGNWSIVKADDGALQWAYKGELVYTHARDKKPGDITGTQFTGSRAWHPIMRSGQPMQGQGGN